MEAKEYFLEIRNMEYKVQILSAEIKHQRELLSSSGAMDYSVDKIQNGSSEKYPAYVRTLERIDKKMREKEELLAEYTSIREEALSKLELLSDDKDKLVLHQKFFLFRTFEQIERETHISFGNVRYHYAKGLKEFEQRELWK